MTFLTLRKTPDMVAGRCGYERAGVDETAEEYYSSWQRVRYPAVVCRV